MDSIVLIFEFFPMYKEDLEIRKNIENNFEELSNFFIDLKSQEFSKIITEIFDACTLLNADFDEFGMNELEFRDILEKSYLQMQEYSDE
jgi:hypothetical protein